MDKSKYYEVQVQLQPSKAEKRCSINLEYYLIESNYSDEDNAQSINTYGIEILKKQQLESNKINVEKKSAYCLSTKKTKIEGLLKCLSRNSVTPMGLNNVLDNLIGISY